MDILRLAKSTWPIFSYIIYALFYTALQHFDLLKQYKIAKSDPSKASLLETSARCFQLQCMHSLIEYFFGDDTLYAEGSEVRFERIVFGTIAIDTYQYFFHRLLHAVPSLYEYAHKAHHKYRDPFAFSALYNSFSESLFLDAGCVVFAILVCRLRAEESILLATIASAKTVQDHAGYMLPFDPFILFPNNAEYHRHHHMQEGVHPVAFQQPFYTFWDWALGTYPKMRPPSYHSVGVNWSSFYPAKKQI